MADPRDIARREESKNRKSGALDKDEQFDVSMYIGSMDKIPGEEVVPVVRISYGSKKKLENTKVSTLKVLEDRGVKVKKDTNGKPMIFGDICSGKLHKYESRIGLKEAVRESENGKYPLVFMSPSRALRNEDYNPLFNPKAKPTKYEWETLRSNIGNHIPLYCLTDPNISIEEDEAFLTGMSIKYAVSKPKKQGYCKRRRNQWKDYARGLIMEGKTMKYVAEEISSKCGHPISAMTICRWSK